MRYQGYAGDTLASALLANGVHLVGRSFKYHRPRGIYSAGVEEPNALVQLARGARTEPNVRATHAELYDGLVAREPELLAVAALRRRRRCNDALSPLLPAGFYYKTFMWPPSPRWWLRYEHFIRRAAGMGRAADASPIPIATSTSTRIATCWSSAAAPRASPRRAPRRAAARASSCATKSRASAASLRRRGRDDRRSTGERLGRRDARELAAQPDVTLLPRTTAFGYYDDNLVGARRARRPIISRAPPAHCRASGCGCPRAGRRARHAARIERGIAYASNDLPGTMLAGAARTYVKRYGVQPGTRAVVFTNNDSAYAAALALHEAGVAIAAIVDARPEAQLAGRCRARARGRPAGAARLA